MKCNADFDLNLKNLQRFYVNTFCDGIRVNCPNLEQDLVPF